MFTLQLNLFPRAVALPFSHVVRIAADRIVIVVCAKIEDCLVSKRIEIFQRESLTRVFVSIKISTPIEIRVQGQFQLRNNTRVDGRSS